MGAGARALSVVVERAADGMKSGASAEMGRRGGRRSVPITSAFRSGWNVGSQPEGTTTGRGAGGEDAEAASPPVSPTSRVRKTRRARDGSREVVDEKDVIEAAVGPGPREAVGAAAGDGVDAGDGAGRERGTNSGAEAVEAARTASAEPFDSFGRLGVERGDAAPPGASRELGERSAIVSPSESSGQLGQSARPLSGVHPRERRVRRNA